MNKYPKFKHEDVLDRILNECLHFHKKNYIKNGEYCENFWHEYNIKISSYIQHLPEKYIENLILKIEDIKK